MRHAAKIDYPIDMTPLMSASITHMRDYGKLQRYGKKLPGDYEQQAKDGWVAKNNDVSNSEQFIEQLPADLLAVERPYVIILELPASSANNPVLPAHRDYNKTCGINVYIDAHGEVTKFYHWNPETKSCEFVEEFCAEPGDIWIMDTDVPHSVTLTPNKARTMLSFCFTKLKYDEVLKFFPTKQ